MVSHLERPRFEKPAPVHVTLRIENDVPSLRSSRRFAAIRLCFAKAKQQRGLRLVKFSVLSNHLHLIVEADDNRSLTRLMQGLCIRMAKALNALLKRRGRIFADHYHSHLLLTPTEVARALEYVRRNAEKHYGERGVDYFSSGHHRWAELLAVPLTWLVEQRLETGAAARVMLANGWRGRW
jgi:putative transposase